MSWSLITAVWLAPGVLLFAILFAISRVGRRSADEPERVQPEDPTSSDAAAE